MMQPDTQYERKVMGHEMGRPRAYTEQAEPMDATTLRLTNWHRRMARRLGDGNMSDGARLAIEEAAIARGLADTIKQPKKKR